jgi:hypothetical protein
VSATVFACGNVLKCVNSIATDALNDIQLKALRQLPKTCDKCKKTSRWIEQQALFDITPTIPPIQRNGGRQNAKTNKDSYRAH